VIGATRATADEMWERALRRLLVDWWARKVQLQQRVTHLGLDPWPHLAWRELDGRARLWDPARQRDTRADPLLDHPLLTVVDGAVGYGLAMSRRELDRWAGAPLAARHDRAWARHSGGCRVGFASRPLLRTERGWQTLGGEPVAVA
jgi:hypothetical protein